MPDYYPCSTGTGYCYHYPSVPVNATLDIGFNYRLPFLNENVMWSLNVTNVLNNKVATFVGVPQIGSLWLTRLSYRF